MSNVRIDDVLCKASTAKAILVDIEGDEHWIPQTQVTYESEVWQKDDFGTLEITEWVAERKGLL